MPAVCPILSPTHYQVGKQLEVVVEHRGLNQLGEMSIQRARGYRLQQLYSILQCDEFLAETS